MPKAPREGPKHGPVRKAISLPRLLKKVKHLVWRAGGGKTGGQKREEENPKFNLHLTDMTRGTTSPTMWAVRFSAMMDEKKKMGSGETMTGRCQGPPNERGPKPLTRCFRGGRKRERTGVPRLGNGKPTPWGPACPPLYQRNKPT